MIHRRVIALYILIMLFQLCHSRDNSHSSSFNIIRDSSEEKKAFQTYAKSFFHSSFHNFSLLSIINQHGKTSLFVVCKNDTIIQISIESLELLNVYKRSGCSYSVKYECEESFTINLLSEMNLLNEKMMWFCYMLPQNNYPSPSLTNCLVPKNNVLPDDLKWTKMGFTSTSHLYRTFAVQSKPHIFIGSYTKNSLMILRTKLPNVLGKIDSSQDLMTPVADFYFEKNSHFLEVFATQYEVYYVVIEPINSKSHTFPECSSSPDYRTVISTRLIRICKDDPGGIYRNNDKNFGTIAKGEVICPVGTGIDQFYYTRSISASWSGDKLYVLFESQKNSPPGKVLCVYDEFSFNIAFNSDMRPPIIFENYDKNQNVDNPIQDLCKKLSTKSLNENEKVEATSISANGLYRLKKVIPIREMPLINLRNLNYHSITTFKLSKMDVTTVIVLIADSSIRMISHMDDFNLCFIQDFHLEKSEKIHQVKGDQVQKNAFVHITTNKRLLQLEFLMCQTYLMKIQCLNDAPSICGWDSRRGKCTLLTEDIDVNRWERSRCQNIKVDDSWRIVEKCIINNDRETLTCTCQYCLDEQGCINGKKVNITDCFGTKHVDTYGDWGSWSECTSNIQFQKRTRLCTSTKCTEPLIAFKKCEYTSTSISTTNWTKWYKTFNNKYRVSFMAKCPLNKFLPPLIEEREIPCDDSCIDEERILKWSSWSDCTETNIQYRLLNCSSIDKCPYSRTEIKQCSSIQSKYLQHSNDKENNYSIIHIILAILVASLIWLLILILVSILIFRYNLVTKQRKKKSKMPLKRLPANISRPIFIPPRFTFSETSNEYLSPDIPSTSSYNHNAPKNLYNPIIENDRAYHNIKHIYAHPFQAKNY